MITESIEPAGTEIIATGFHTAIFCILLKKEGCVIDMTVYKSGCSRRIRKDMIEVAPLTMITIRRTGAMCALHSCRDLYQPGGNQPAERGVSGIIIEVAGYQDTRFGRQPPQGIDRRAQPLGYCHTCRPRYPLSSQTAGSMHHKDMKRVAIAEKAAGIKNVTRRTMIIRHLHPDAVPTEKTKRKRRIKQRHVNASLIRAVGHNIVITRPSQKRAAGEIEEHAVILHLRECHQVRDLLLTAGKDLLPDPVHLPPITVRRPVMT